MHKAKSIDRVAYQPGERMPFQMSARRFFKNCIRDKELILMVILPVLYYLIFCYGPMYGIQIAFRDFVPSKGITGSTWVGLKHFKQFFESFYFGRLIRNTLIFNIYSLIFGFPVPIIFALMLNEVRSRWYKKIIQSVTYFPYFISTVIVVSMITLLFAADTGVLNFTGLFTGTKISVTNNPDYFRGLYIGSSIWHNFGFSAVLYMAAIAGIDMEKYEAATIDGASRLQKIFYITLPAIMPTIMIRMLLELGSMFSMGSEKLLLMQGSNSATLEVSDVISTYVYRVGLIGVEYSFGSAVGLFNTVLNFLVLVVFNWLARRFSETSLW